MKKICVMVAFLALNHVGFGQNLDDINEMMGKNQYRQAKEAIDKYLSDSKNAAKPDGWYFKGRIYNAYSRDTTVSLEDVLKYKIEAFEAFKKNQSMDKLDLRLKLENYVSYFDLYNGFFDIGAKGFNKQHFESAFNGFKAALQVEEYVRPRGYEVNGFKFPAMDTSLILNTAISARQAKNEEAAITYYKMLEGASVSGPNYIEVYAFLAETYNRKKDAGAFAAIAAKGKNLYPAEPYWDESYYETAEIENATKGLQKEELFRKYDELLVKYPNNFVANYNYSIELYKYIYSQDIKPEEVAGYKTRFEEVLKKTIAIKSNSDDNFLMANFLYNNSFDLTDESKKIKGTRPEDNKKRNELVAASRKAMEDCIPFAETAADLFSKLPKLKATEKNNYKQCYDILSEVYRVKGDAKKSADYKAKKEAIN